MRRHADGEVSEHHLLKSDDGVIYSWHLRCGSCKLDVMDHSEVGFASFFGRSGNCYAPYNHSYIPYRWSRALVLPSWGLLLGWIGSFLVNERL